MNTKFKVGDKIQHKNIDNFGYANIMSGPFVIIGVTNKDYVLKQPNFIGNRNIEVINNCCELSR